MSREIEFRIWDKELGMDYNPKLGPANNDLNNQFATALGILMQYTGLKDKNGVKIFEGDIVKESYSDAVHEIRWSQDNSGFWMGTTHHLNLGVAKELEVIGNVYENEELIKER